MEFDVIPTGEDLPPNRGANIPEPPRIATCEICGDEWEHTGKGPLPKRCKEHKAARAGAKTTANDALLKNAVGDFYRGIGLLAMPFDMFVATTIANGADTLADSWMELAKTDPKVRKFLTRMTQTGGWAGVVVAHAMVAMPIMQHKGIIPGAKERERVS